MRREVPQALLPTLLIGGSTWRDRLGFSERIAPPDDDAPEPLRFGRILHGGGYQLDPEQQAELDRIWARNHARMAAAEAKRQRRREKRLAKAGAT